MYYHRLDIPERQPESCNTLLSVIITQWTLNSVNTSLDLCILAVEENDYLDVFSAVLHSRTFALKLRLRPANPLRGAL